MTDPTPEQRIDRLREDMRSLRETVGTRIVGQANVVEGALICLLCGGHALLEGVPGLGKTLLVRTLAEAMSLQFSRIQFTPDLMPADIVGTTVITETPEGGRDFQFRRGPIFANVVLADEVNRATPKTQSALLEVMGERSVTVGRSTYSLEPPYIVLATQNPLEMEGTYPLPEAQLDRFLLKLKVDFPGHDELHAILDRTTGSSSGPLAPVVDGEQILAMQRTVRDVEVARHVQDYAVRLLEATHPDRPGAPPKVTRFVRFGSGPRGAQATLLSAKARAAFDGRFHVSTDDVRAAMPSALRHRIILNFEGEAEGIQPDEVLDDVLGHVREQAS